MKTSRAFALAAAALIAGFLMARLCVAQPSNQPFAKEPASYDFGALQQLASFASYLQDTKQTNTLQRFNDFLSASTASQLGADLGVTLAILQRLRDGRTNEAYELLEGRFDTDIIGFVASYRELPASAREQPGLKVLGWARDYRVKFRFKHRYANVDDGVAEAFKILDEKTTK
ncbi:MAG: hypothetical protein ABSG78_15180 [Verrucomicrobiota bacterium]|jgi:hypothetical protein